MALPKISIKQPKVNPQGKQKIKQIAIFLAIIILICALWMLFSAISTKQVTVVQLKQSLGEGDVITESVLGELEISVDTYNKVGVTQYYTPEGNQVTGQTLVLWEDRTQLYDKFAVSYIQAGRMLTTVDATDTKIIRNPWLRDVEEGMEIYDLAFNIRDINTRLLFPGTTIRIRLTVSVPADKLEEIRAKIEAKESGGTVTISGGTSEPMVQQVPKMNEDGTPELDEEGQQVYETVTLPGTETSTEMTIDADQSVLLASSGITMEETSMMTGKIPVSEIVVDEIIIADMLNSNRESIFDLYTALMNMPVDERVKYLQTKIEEDNESFQQRVTPTQLSFVVTKEQATALAEFEALTGAQIKYTIIPKKDEDLLLNQFTEISNQMNSVFKGITGKSINDTEGQ